MEHALVFPNSHGQSLVGVWHEPPAAPRAVLVMLHGWSGTRCGPHQMLTRAARRFCAEGYGVLRFDFAGRGDSDGETELATLATMRNDVKSALALVKSRCQAPVWLLGLCSGCEIAVAAVDNSLAGAILWSAPIFAALPADSSDQAKRAANWRKYARKMLNPSTYGKILRGQIDTVGVKAAMSGGGGAAHKNVEADAPGQLPPGFRRAALTRFQTFEGELWQIYGGADPIFPAASAWYRQNSAREPRFHVVEGANHSFYGLAWENEVVNVTLDWLKSQRSLNS